jgi:O-antigen/teichoic acid export membrane protein
MVSAIGSIDRLRPRLAAWAERHWYAVPALDQVSLSLFNLGLNLVLVRLLTATDFGVVSLWMAVSLLAVGVQNALVNGPLLIYLPAAPDAAAARRLEAAIAGVNLLAIVATACAVAAVGLVADAEWAPPGVAAAIVIPLFVAAGMYREYYRTIAFSRHDMAMLLWTDLPYIGATALCLAAMIAWPDHLAGLAGALLAMSAGCAFSQSCLHMRRRFRFPPPFRRGALTAYRGIVREVAWSLVGVLANHVETRCYAYIATCLVGLAALAAINVVGLLFRPVTVLMGAWSRAALPKFARLLSRGEVVAFERMLMQALAVAAIGSVALYLALLLAWPPIERLLLAGKYPDAAVLLLPWAAASGVSLLRYVSGIALQAAREFKFLAYAQTVCGALSAAATVAVILWWGYEATMWGIAIGNAACLLWQLLRLRRVHRPDYVASQPRWDTAAADSGKDG